MDIQTLMVALILLIAIIYIGKMGFNKLKSFSNKSGCGNNCGCDSKPKKFTKIYSTNEK